MTNIPAEIDALLRAWLAYDIIKRRDFESYIEFEYAKDEAEHHYMTVSPDAIPAIRALVEERESHIHEIAALQVFNKVLNTTTKLLETKNEELCLENNSLQAENERLKAAASVTYEVKQLTEQEAQVVDEFFLGPKPNDQD